MDVVHWTMTSFIFFCISISFSSLSLSLTHSFFSFFSLAIITKVHLVCTQQFTYMRKLYFLQVLTNKRIAYNWKDFRMSLLHQKHFYSTILFLSFEKVFALSKSARIRTLDSKSLLVVPSTILYFLLCGCPHIYMLNVIFFLWNKFLAQVLTYNFHSFE